MSVGGVMKTAGGGIGGTPRLMLSFTSCAATDEADNRVARPRRASEGKPIGVACDRSSFGISSASSS